MWKIEDNVMDNNITRKPTRNNSRISAILFTGLSMLIAVSIFGPFSLVVIVLLYLYPEKIDEQNRPTKKDSDIVTKKFCIIGILLILIIPYLIWNILGFLSYLDYIVFI